MATNRPMICVYCGSRSGVDARYPETARAMGRAIADAGWGLIYGAGDAGLMGLTARAALERQAPVLGFIPRRLIGRENANDDLTATVITETMHERKKLMMENADAVIALPGGIGTMDELVEAITWRQLDITPKPVFVLNAHGYFDPFLALLRHIIDQGFAGEETMSLFEVVDSPGAAIERIAAVIGRSD